MNDSLVGLNKKELNTLLTSMGVPEKQLNMRTNQLWNWIYVRGATSIDEMTNLSKEFRSELSKKFTVSRPEITKNETSSDGTQKWLIKFPDGSEIETVFIPDGDRGTLCVSSQVGCTLNCKFCHTGTQKLVRNLTSQEIDIFINTFNYNMFSNFDDKLDKNIIIHKLNSLNKNPIIIK